MNFVLAELESFRMSVYGKDLIGDKDSCALFLHHIRSISKYDFDSLGLEIKFSEGNLPEKNTVLNQPYGIKAMKKVLQFIDYVHKDPESSALG